jgi:O-antigen ligase
MRSFPRNALTYAGVCAGVLPFAMFLVWVGDGRRRWLGRFGVAACLFGAGFSLARGAWVALAIGIVYLLFDAPLSRQRKLQFVAVGIAGAIVLTGVFLVKYNVDPLSGRAGGGASVKTRDFLYKDTLGALKGVHLALGYGTEQPRTANGLTHQQGGAYVPRSGTHSTYLNYLFRTGLPGLLLVVALYALAFLCARAAAKTRAGPEQLFAGMCAVAVVIAAAHDVILSLYVEPIYTLLISVILGLAIAGGIGAGASLLPWRTQKTR